MRVLVIEPGHGSVWLSQARYEGEFVVGEAWDDSGRGSALLPDDYGGEPITLTFPRTLILRTDPPDPPAMTTALETIREDQALGAAWRRAEAALPEGWRFSGLSPLGFGTWLALAIGSAPFPGICDCCGQVRHDRPTASAQGPTPTAALEALAEKLETL